jgi:nucleotide-binding universal stress UspA family protein
MSSQPCVVIAYDGSPTSRAALAWARDRVGPDGKIVAVHAFEPPADWRGSPGYQRVLDEHRSLGQALLDELESDAVLETELIAGPPAETVAKVASTRGASEIVVGSRGVGRMRAALGSVSHDLLHIAPCPVVVIPPPEDR